MKVIQKGFTLIELMIVLVIIGILAAMIVPKFSDYVAKTQVMEGIKMADAAKVRIEENGQNGICTDPYVTEPSNDPRNPDANTVIGRYARLVIGGQRNGNNPNDPIAPTGCTVTITYGQGLDAAGNAGTVSDSLRDKELVLSYLRNGSYAVIGEENENSVPTRLLPKSLVRQAQGQNVNTQ